MKAAVDLLVERLNGLMPRFGIVLGSGLGSLVDEVRDAVRIPYSLSVPCPAMPGSSSPVISARRR
jgi:purine nucleoside phosphorylase